VRGGLGLDGRAVLIGKLGLQECEIAHALSRPRFARAASARGSST
jgi:hypothetical protein